MYRGQPLWRPDRTYTAWSVYASDGSALPPTRPSNGRDLWRDQRIDDSHASYWRGRADGCGDDRATDQHQTGRRIQRQHPNHRDRRRGERVRGDGHAEPQDGTGFHRPARAGRELRRSREHARGYSVEATISSYEGFRLIIQDDGEMFVTAEID